jgi:hypothetical protein
MRRNAGAVTSSAAGLRRRRVEGTNAARRKAEPDTAQNTERSLDHLLLLWQFLLAAVSLRRLSSARARM